MPIVKAPVVFKVKPKLLAPVVKKAPVKRVKVDLCKATPAVPLTTEERSKPPHRKAPATA